MTHSSEVLAIEISRVMSAELAAAQVTIKHCIEQLTDDRLWWRPAPTMNSMGNLILHLCGNVRQWIVSGVGGAADSRNRPLEFAEQGPIPKNVLLQQLSETVNSATVVLSGVTSETLLGARTIQGFDVTGLEAIVQSVAHFRGHTQEIVHMTRCLLGERYVYRFVPQTPEQGAPTE